MNEKWLCMDCGRIGKRQKKRYYVQISEIDGKKRKITKLRLCNCCFRIIKEIIKYPHILFYIRKRLSDGNKPIRKKSSS